MVTLEWPSRSESTFTFVPSCSQERRLHCVRAELGLPKPDGTGRFVKRYWLERAELETLAREGARV